MHFGKKERNSLKISYGNEENESKTGVINEKPSSTFQQRKVAEL